MNARKLKTFAVLLGISTMVLMNSGANAKARGGDSGGGGDASEVRVNEIRSDILNWINNGGAKNLALPNSLLTVNMNLK